MNRNQILVLLAILGCAGLMGVLLVAAAIGYWFWGQRRSFEDLGGVRLVYEADLEALKETGDGAASLTANDWNALVPALEQRLASVPPRGVVVRRLGASQIEILIAAPRPGDLEQIRRRIAATGLLEFRIVANSRDHERIIHLAEEQAKDPTHQKSRRVMDGERLVGYWAHVPREPRPGADGIRPLKVSVQGYTVRNAATGALIVLPENFDWRSRQAFERHLDDAGIAEIEVLVATDDGLDVSGRHLSVARRGIDETDRPCVNFTMTAAGAPLMTGLTTLALPDRNTEHYRLLGIILDGELLSAPRVMSTIGEHGRITGQFTTEEVAFIVDILQAGSLPIALKPQPVSETVVPPRNSRG